MKEWIQDIEFRNQYSVLPLLLSLPLAWIKTLYLLMLRRNRVCHPKICLFFCIIDYFKLVIFKKQKTQGEPLPPSLPALRNSNRKTCSEKGAITLVLYKLNVTDREKPSKVYLLDSPLSLIVSGWLAKICFRNVCTFSSPCGLLSFLVKSKPLSPQLKMAYKPHLSDLPSGLILLWNLHIYIHK